MAKLLRRQNKMSEAEQVVTEQPPPPPEYNENKETDKEEDKSAVALQSKPPPPPQRKTPSLTPPAPHPLPQVAPLPANIPPQEPASTEATGLVKQLKSKPPISKPREVEPEMSPWQLELAARKARLAEHESGTDAQVVASKEDEVQDREPSPSSAPKPIAAPFPKLKRKPPQPAVKLAASPELPPPVPPSEQPPSPTTVPAEQPPPLTSISTLQQPPPPTSLQQPSSVPPREHVPPVPRVVTEEAESQALPAEVSALASGSIDHCKCSTLSHTIECTCAHFVLTVSYTVSRSTSMSSLTTGTGSVGFSLCIYSN